MSIKDGYYDCRATGKVEYGLSSKNNDQIAVWIEVLEDLSPDAQEDVPRTVLCEDFSTLTFSPDATGWTIDKLKSLGFGGELDALTLAKGTIARCEAKTESFTGNDGKARTNQKFEIVTFVKKPFKDEKVMAARDVKRFAERYQGLLSGKAPAPAPRSNGSRGAEPPAGRFDDDFNFPGVPR